MVKKIVGTLNNPYLIAVVVGFALLAIARSIIK